MRFSTQTGNTITSAFEQYDAANPDVYEHFKKYAFQWMNMTPGKISSKQIIGRIRWFNRVENYDPAKGEFKINDAFTAHYARKFISEYPEHADRFEMRELRSL